MGNSLSSPLAVILNAGESRTQNFKRELLRRGWRVEEFTCENWREVVSKGYEYLCAIRRGRFTLAGMGFPWQGVWLLLAKLIRHPIILDCPMDVTEPPFAQAWHCKKTVEFFSRRADFFLTLKSRAYLIQKFGLNPDRVLFLENCPDQERIERGLQNSPAFTLSRGRVGVCSSGVAPWHRIDRFVPIFRQLLSRIPNLLWLIISDPQCEMVNRVRSKAAELQLLDSIKFLPVIRPFESFVATVAQCDLWISHLGNDSLLGRHELRMGLLEMGILAMPVVACSTPALQMHNFLDGKNIIVIDAEDPDCSADRIAYYLEHPTELRRIGSSLRQHVLEKFSLAKSIDRVVSLV